jgi:hypothetical protein
MALIKMKCNKKAKNKSIDIKIYYMTAASWRIKMIYSINYVGTIGCPFEDKELLHRISWLYHRHESENACLRF